MNKQIRFTTESLSPLFKASVGFDNLVNEFFNEPAFANATGYPPYNISKDSNDVYEITLAVAGFKKSDIELELEDGTLKITGTSDVLDTTDTNKVEYLHKGIAERNFVRTFKLAEYVEVKDANLEDGILKVRLLKNIPDALKPQKIQIS
jgi:molecular chaperone IbpA|tara:strand:+ start:1336 stop:1782 length:447 start_codon:yes stop_codon:yes gene_type:complete